MEFPPKWTLCFAACAMLAGTVALAEDFGTPTKVGPPTEAPLERAALSFNQLLLSGGPKATACRIGSGETFSTTTLYFLSPFQKQLDGSFGCAVKWSVVSKSPNQQPRVQVYDANMHLRLQGDQVMRVQRYSYGQTDMDRLEELGNGLSFGSPGAGNGDVESIEYVRKPNGTVEGIQRYKGLTTTVVYYEVAVPPELKADPANLNAPQFSEVSGVIFEEASR